MLELKNIGVEFMAGTPDANLLFSDFNLTVRDHEFVSIVGSNGSGKTTLLNLVGGSLVPNKGNVIFNGRDITFVSEYKRAKKFGRVFQDPHAGTCSGLTILENMALADNKGRSFGLGRAIGKKNLDKYQTLLEQCGMGLENRLGTLVGTLSGGQRQALALVIANMTDIDLLILDEHTAALDPKSSETIMELTKKLVEKKNITTLMVTHNLRYAVNYGTRLLMMHEGRCVIDASGDDKKRMSVEEILEKFNEISIECGN